MQKLDNKVIFRSQAVEHYRQSYEKDVIPSFVAPPFVAFLWILATLFAGLGLVAWTTELPIYLPAQVILNPETENNSAWLYIATEDAKNSLQTGQTVLIKTGSETLQAQIVAIEPELVKPAQLRQRFNLDNDLKISGTVKLSKLEFVTKPQKYYAGLLTAQIKIGNRRLLNF